MNASPAPFGTFHATLAPDEIADARSLQLRTLATWAYIHLLPGFLFVRQRSEFIQGWEMAAKGGTTLDSGVSAGAVGVAGAPALGSWMMLPNLTDEHTQTVLPMNDSLYGAAHVELTAWDPSSSASRRTSPTGATSRRAARRVYEQLRPPRPEVDPRRPRRALARRTRLGGDDARLGTGVIRSPTASAVLYHRALVGYEPGDIDASEHGAAGSPSRPLNSAAAPRSVRADRDRRPQAR